MVMLKIVTAWAPLILARIRTRTFAFASFNTLNYRFYNLFVRVKLPTFLNPKKHVVQFSIILQMCI